MDVLALARRRESALNDLDAISKRLERGEISFDEANSQTLAVMNELERDTAGHIEEMNKYWDNRLLKNRLGAAVGAVFILVLYFYSKNIAAAILFGFIAAYGLVVMVRRRIHLYNRTPPYQTVATGWEAVLLGFLCTLIGVAISAISLHRLWLSYLAGTWR